MKLTFKITTLVLFVVMTLFLFFGYLVVVNEKKFLIQLQDKQGKAISNTISTSIIDPILEQDYPAIDTVLENTSSAYSDLVFIKIISNNKVISKVHNENLTKKNETIFKSDVTIGKDTIATVIVGISNFANESIINDRITIFIITAIIISVLLSISLIMIIKYFLINRINLISNYAKRVSLENLNKPIHINSHDEFEELSQNINKMTKQLDNEINENKIKDEILAQQSKMASMGEMISNIAHQWRQPLSAISSSASGMKLEKELDVLDDDSFNKSIKTIINSTKYLSETIEIFRNFLRNEKIVKTMNIDEILTTVFDIINTSLKNHLIDLIIKKPETPILLTIITGELEQVIINILNNAKDALIEKKIKSPWIILEIEEKDDIIKISIEDNAGGIAKDVMPNIFAPYFTTKHKSLGTGLGLHMSYNIVTHSLKGKIYAKNSENGAKFYIEIPNNCKAE